MHSPFNEQEEGRREGRVEIKIEFKRTRLFTILSWGTHFDFNYKP